MACLLLKRNYGSILVNWQNPFLTTNDNKSINLNDRDFRRFAGGSCGLLFLFYQGFRRNSTQICKLFRFIVSACE